MTRSDFIKYVKLRREIGITAKSIVLSFYWRLVLTKRFLITNLIKISRQAGLILSGYILINAFLPPGDNLTFPLHPFGLIVLSLVVAGITLRLIK